MWSNETRITFSIQKNNSTLMSTLKLVFKNSMRHHHSRVQHISRFWFYILENHSRMKECVGILITY